jgi:hypothetical protein
MNDEIVNRIAAANELTVKKQFEKLKYSVERLDRKKEKRARPDFLVSRSGRPQMLCEVKTILSAGYLHNKGVHVSTLDENLRKFEIPIDLKNIDDCLADAVHQRAVLVEDCPEFKRLPFLVALFFDLFADFLHCYPRTFNEAVSGILTIETDVARTKAFAKLSRQEQEGRLRTGQAAGLPPHSKDFALVRNKAARRKVPKDFQIQCITEPYDAPL